MTPIKETITRTRKKTIKPARYMDIDTGVKRVIETINENGEKNTVLEPVMDKVFLDPVSIDEEYQIDVWAVYDGAERHEFLSEQDAIRFCGGR